MDLVKRLEEYRDRERELQWEGTFAQYFEIATKKSEVTRLAHERIYHMIMDAGVGTSRTGEPLYNFSAMRSSALKNLSNRLSSISTLLPNVWKCVSAFC